jgi:hypothetical protein
VLAPLLRLVGLQAPPPGWRLAPGVELRGGWILKRGER